MDIIEAIYHRRSVRAFTTDAVPSEVIDDLVSVAVQAPSAMNLQPWAFLIIEGQVTLLQFSEHAKRHLLETTTPESPFFHYRDQLSKRAFDIFYGASLLVVIAATSDAAQSAEDCCLAAQNLMLAALKSPRHHAQHTTSHLRRLNSHPSRPYHVDSTRPR